MSATDEPAGPQDRPPTEEELRAAYESEIKKIKIEHVLLEHVVTLVNLGMRRTGIAPGTEDERDPEQVRLAIEAIRSILPVIETAVPEQATPIRDALSQLQLAFVKLGGGEGQRTAPAGDDSPTAEGGEQQPGPGPAQKSGRLWIPGQ